MSLSVPPAIKDVLSEFDAATTSFDALDVRSRIQAATDSLGTLSEPERRGVFAEWAAFSFVGADHSPEPWDAYFGPMFTGETASGKTVHQPDLAQVDTEIITHWLQRASEVTHPELKARYADLVWDLGSKVPDALVRREAAVTAADAYLASAAGPEPDALDSERSARRALTIAIQVRDAQRIGAARAILLALHQQLVEAGRYRLGPYDALVADRRANLSLEDRAALVAGLEAMLARASSASGGGFDPHAAEEIGERLAKHYVKSGQRDEARRIYLTVATAFEHFASLGSALLASGALQTSMEAYRRAGARPEAERVRRLMAEKVKASADEMVEHRVEVKVSFDEQEAFLAKIVEDEWWRTLMNIGGGLMLRRAQLEQQVSGQSASSPLMSMVSQTIISHDRVVGTVGSVEDDPFGRLIRQAAWMLEFSTPWLGWAMERAIEKHSLNAGHFAAFANRAGLFGDGSLLLEGLQAWLAKDYVKAAHVLVPQVERGLRALAGLKGQPTTKTSTKYGTAQMAVTMGDILYSQSYIAALGKAGADLAIHFAALYADPRAKNLRNELAHGLIVRQECSEGVMLWIVHSLLMLGGWVSSPSSGGSEAAES